MLGKERELVESGREAPAYRAHTDENDPEDYPRELDLAAGLRAQTLRLRTGGPSGALHLGGESELNDHRNR